MADTSFPAAASSPAATSRTAPSVPTSAGRIWRGERWRTETGTAATSGRSSVLGSSLVRATCRRKAPPTPVKSTSLTVTPTARATIRRSSSGTSTIATHRWAAMAPFHGARGAPKGKSTSDHGRGRDGRPSVEICRSPGLWPSSDGLGSLRPSSADPPNADRHPAWPSPVWPSPAWPSPAWPPATCPPPASRRRKARSSAPRPPATEPSTAGVGQAASPAAGLGGLSCS